jgi:septal ring factor EnvC (AmiA/AmiB activator)
MLDDQARADAGAVDRGPGTESGQSLESEQIDLLIQSFGDQYVAHLRALTAKLEQFHARRLAGRDEQNAQLTAQLAARDAQLVELRRQLAASEGEHAELTARLQATVHSEMRYAQSLRVLDDQVLRLLEAHGAGHRTVGNNEEQVS